MTTIIKEIIVANNKLAPLTQFDFAKKLGVDGVCFGLCMKWVEIFLRKRGDKSTVRLRRLYDERSDALKIQEEYERTDTTREKVAASRGYIMKLCAAINVNMTNLHGTYLMITSYALHPNEFTYFNFKFMREDGSKFSHAAIAYYGKGRDSNDVVTLYEPNAGEFSDVDDLTDLLARIFEDYEKKNASCIM